MCWRCGAVRPYDGPYPKKGGDWGKGYIVGDGTIAIPNEAAAWEDELIAWPAWNQADSQNIPFFLIVENEDGNKVHVKGL